MQSNKSAGMVRQGESALASSPLHSLRRKVAESNDETRHLTYGLVVELLTTALFTTVTISMLNAKVQRRTLRFVGPVATCLPEEPGSLSELASTRPDAFFSESLTMELDKAYEQLRFALSVTPRDDLSWSSEDVNRGAPKWAELKNFWQPLAVATRMILMVLEELDLVLWSDQIPRLFEIEGLLKSATSGGTPCVRADGLVFVPGWLDRRRERRVPLGISVWIDSARGRQRVLLNDLSVSGLGLAQCQSLELDSAVSAELPNGRILEGAVIWSYGGNIGLRFFEPLNESDRLFSQVVSLRRMAGYEAMR